MKKRLLSALLALVMVLAMLPATVFAAEADTTLDNPPADTEEVSTPQDDPEGQGGGTGTQPIIPATSNNAGRNTSAASGTTAVYKDRNAAGTTVNGQQSGVITGAPGWYTQVTTSGITTYEKIDSGFVAGSKYYASWSDVPASNQTNFTSIGTQNVSIPSTATSATIEVYSGGLTITGGNNLGSLTVQDSKFYSENKAFDGRSTVALPSGFGSNSTKSVTLKLTNVTTSDDISMSGPYTHTVTLDNASAGSITLDGTGVLNNRNTSTKQTVSVNTENDNYRRNSSVGDISVIGTGSTVTLVDVTAQTAAPTVALNGTGTSLTVGGNSDIGKVTIEDGLAAAASTAISTIKVNAGTVGDIAMGSTGKGTGTVTIQVNGGETGDIDLTRNGANPTPAITVTSATTGDITTSAGTLSVGGTYATVGALDLSGSAKFSLSGTNHTVGEISVASGFTGTISVPAESSNTLSLGSPFNYAGHGISGGTWILGSNAMPAAALNSNLAYVLNYGGYSTYYNADQLGEALIKQYQTDATHDSSNSNLHSVRLGSYDNTYLVKFMNGGTLWGIMRVGGEMQIKLPTSINNVTVTNWADSWRSWPAGSMYSTPAVADVTGGSWELNASGGVTNGDITKLTGVTATLNNVQQDNMGTVKAVLNGNVITLSGAVPAGDCNMTLHLATDAVENNNGTDKPVVLDIGVIYYSGTKSLVFSNVETDLGHGATMQTETGTTVLRLSNGTKYTLNGSGLKERSDNITVTTDADGKAILVNASSLRTQELQLSVAAMINGGTDGTGASFDWTNSPAMKEAVNAALATITDSQVANWITAAQRAAWQKKNTGTPSTSNLTDTGYDTAYLVVYLQVNVSANGYLANGSLTATLVPSWRVEIRQSTSNDYAGVFADSRNPSQPESAYIAKAGTALQLTGDVATPGDWTTNVGVKVKFANLFDGNPAVNKLYMHQDNTNVYTADANSVFTIRHAGTGSNLGTMVINTTQPLVKLYGAVKQDSTRDLTASYDTLQAAVDDAEDGWHIDVDQNYKGSMNINVTGTARTFTIQGNGNNVVVSNTNNGLVTLNSTGGLYTVQLTRDATAVGGTTADITVASGVTNGTVTLSTTRARANTDVNVTTTPAAGYLTRNLTATARTSDNTNVTVAVTKTSDNHYTFKVPTGATSITVTPTFAIDTGMPFTDVEASDPYFEAVKYVYEHNPQLMNGMTSTSFGGYGTITRGQVVTILYRLSGSPSVSSYSGFTDVNTSKYYAAPITWAKSNGIVDGYGTTFGPEDAITREQLAKILRDYSIYRGLNVSKTTSLNGYTDAGSVHSWAVEGMQWSVANGIVTGTTTTTLSPGNSAQRYHAATMLMRYCTQYGL